MFVDESVSPAPVGGLKHQPRHLVQAALAAGTGAHERAGRVAGAIREARASPVAGRIRRRRGMNRPSFGRALAVRGLDQFDTPPVALDPLFAHEPLLAGVRAAWLPSPMAFSIGANTRREAVVSIAKAGDSPRSIVLPRVDSGGRYWLGRQGVKR
jgi:hypothetical protein